MRDQKTLAKLAERLEKDLPLSFRSGEDGVVLTSPGPGYLELWHEVKSMNLTQEEQGWVLQEVEAVVDRRHPPGALLFRSGPNGTEHRHRSDIVMSRPVRWEEEPYRLW